MLPMNTIKTPTKRNLSKFFFVLLSAHHKSFYRILSYPAMSIIFSLFRKDDTKNMFDVTIYTKRDVERYDEGVCIKGFS